MIESMDDAVGTLLDTLDRLKLADRTIIVFASDNGGNMYNEIDGTTPTSNGPLRGGKATMYEGGVRGPCVVVWPKNVKGNTKSDALIQSCDFYPTLLEMLKLTPKKNQKFDGVSLVPALQGRELKREEIFTYFPHQPRVPDWLPPAVSVHRGDWKLIRIFHGGKDGAHRWKLFHLRDDVGEKHDLSAKHPERVKELDSLIEHFLEDTKAVRPQPNPVFDPSKYRPEVEGKPQSKPTKKRPVAGWRANKDCVLIVKDKGLVLKSTGRDPHASYILPKPLPAGEYTLHIRMSSNSRGRAQFFWQEQGIKPAFFRDRSNLFDVHHDGDAHEYKVAFTAKKPIVAVRLDPSQGKGETHVHAMQLLDRSGKLVRSWRFVARKP